MQSAETKGKRKKVGPYCCVTGCHSARGREEVGFFKAKRHSPSLTDSWARAIKRQNKDGTLWFPSKFSVICGNHFRNGEPSIEPGNPDYVPSVFDETEHNNHQSNKRKSEVDEERFDRLKVRVLNQNDAKKDDSGTTNADEVSLICYLKKMESSLNPMFTGFFKSRRSHRYTNVMKIFFDKF